METNSPFVAPLPYPAYPDIDKYSLSFGVPTPWEFSGWMAESMSWKTGCYIHAGLSGPQTRISGPNAAKLMERVSINGFSNWEPGTEKHLVMLTPEGSIASHGLCQRTAEDEFTLFAAGIWPLYQAQRLGIEVTGHPVPLYIFQVSGPTALQTLERATGEDLRDIKFLRYRKAVIDGVEVEIGRIGMSGTLAFEVRGPYDEGPRVYDTIFRAGADFGIERLGWLTYLVNHVEGGFPQGGWTFKFAQPADGGYRDYLAQFGMDWVLNVRNTGSYDPADEQVRTRTPFDVGWGRYAKFDHDFVGREALEKTAENPTRTIATLRWDPEDVVDIYSSLLKPGEEYTQLTLPVSSGGLVSHADRVLRDGRVVGVASAPVYSYYHREVISHVTIDAELAQPGSAVEVEWGTHGGRIKKVRATVERYPYLELERNQNYDLNKIPNEVASAV